MKFLIILAATVISLTYSADAQSQSQPQSESEPKRTCRIVFPERPNDAPKIAYIFDGEQSQQVALPSMNFSNIIALPAGDITLLMTPSVITDLENLPLGAPRLKIKEGIKDFYILVTPDPSNSILPLKMNLVSASDGKFKPGETLWFNLTDHRIAAKLGESKLVVNPKSSKVSESPISGSGYYRAEFAYQSEAEGNLQKITEQQWWHDAKSRHLGFIVNTGGKLPKLYFYRDFR